jgi:hypothetical protein
MLDIKFLKDIGFAKPTGGPKDKSDGKRINCKHIEVEGVTTRGEE